MSILYNRICSRKARFFIGLAITLTAAPVVHAQRFGPRQGRPQPSGPEVRPPYSSNDETDHHADTELCRGSIYKYELPDEARADDCGFLGLLRVRPSDSGVGVQKIEVSDDAETRISLAGHQFDSWDYAGILTKGLFCKVHWSQEKGETEKGRKVTRKVLRSLEFETMVIRGEIDEIGDDGIVLKKAKPKNNALWPDVAAYFARISNITKDKIPATPRSKKLKLSYVEPVTRFVDSSGASAYLYEFNEADEVEAVIVYGGKGGLLVELRGLTDDGRYMAQPPQDDSPPRRGIPPPRVAPTP